MKLETWLKAAESQLQNASIGTARLDAMVLLEDVTGKDRAWLLAHPDFELTTKQANVLKNVLNRRVSHEPLAYIRGKIEFYGHEFVLTPAVLQPRPESETMIDLLKQLPLFPKDEGRKSTEIRLADVGTGSGALGITAKLELPELSVDLLEIDEDALNVAKSNVDKFTLSINAIKSNLLENIKESYDVLLCNLPYVPDDFHINQAASKEPEIAIFGGPDGLDIYKRLFKQVQKLPKMPLYILSESLPTQHDELARIAKSAGYGLVKTDDLIQVFLRS